jgi:hypothetical protein
MVAKQELYRVCSASLYDASNFINIALGNAISSIAIGTAAVFITLGSLGHRYTKTEVTLPNGAKAC